MPKPLAGSNAHRSLEHAFAGESEANRRYLYFARPVHIEGYPGATGHFRDGAEGETALAEKSCAGEFLGAHDSLSE